MRSALEHVELAEYWVACAQAAYEEAGAVPGQTLAETLRRCEAATRLAEVHLGLAKAAEALAPSDPDEGLEALALEVGA